MAFTGARISEVLALTAGRIDVADEAIIFETLKQRKKKVFRAVRIETTAIYASAIGDEERNLARCAWSSLELAIPDRTGPLA